MAELVQDDHYQQTEHDQDGGQGAEIGGHHQAGNNDQGQAQESPRCSRGSIRSGVSGPEIWGLVAMSTTGSCPPRDERPVGFEAVGSLAGELPGLRVGGQRVVDVTGLAALEAVHGLLDHTRYIDPAQAAV